MKSLHSKSSILLVFLLGLSASISSQGENREEEGNELLMQLRAQPVDHEDPKMNSDEYYLEEGFKSFVDENSRLLAAQSTELPVEGSIETQVENKQEPIGPQAGEDGVLFVKYNVRLTLNERYQKDVTEEDIKLFEEAFVESAERNLLRKFAMPMNLVVFPEDHKLISTITPSNVFGDDIMYLGLYKLFAGTKSGVAAAEALKSNQVFKRNQARHIGYIERLGLDVVFNIHVGPSASRFESFIVGLSKAMRKYRIPVLEYQVFNYEIVVLGENSVSPLFNPMGADMSEFMETATENRTKIYVGSRSYRELAEKIMRREVDALIKIDESLVLEEISTVEETKRTRKAIKNLTDRI